MITKLDIEEIKLFLSESNRIREERFLRGITDNYENRLVFSHNTCTDGNLVQVYPHHPFVQNLVAVEKVGREFKISIPSTWLLLKIFARSGIAHESFHILFTDFRVLKRMEKEFQKEHPFKKKTMFNINNIVEDSFIELAGINYLNGLEFYIEFGNLLAYENIPNLEEMEQKCKNKEIPWTNLFLHWAMMYAITGKTKGVIKNRKIKNRIKKAQPLFDKGRYEKDANQRYEYVKEIYSIIEDIVEKDIEEFGMNQPDFQYFKNNVPNLEEVLGTDVEIKKDFRSRNNKSKQDDDKANNRQSGEKDQDGNDSSDGDKDDKDKTGSSNSGNDQANKTKTQKDGKATEIDSSETDNINIDDNPETDSQSKKDENKEKSEEEEQKKLQEEANKLLKELEEEKNSVEKEEDDRQKMEKREEELEKRIQRELSKVQYSQLHRDIWIVTNKKFQPLPNQEAIYERIFNQYRGIIEKFANMLSKLIKDQDESWETKLMIGSMLDTRRLADNKRRFWKKEVDKKEVADLCIQLLIDGSGSMEEKVHDVIRATIILYEVAKKLNIPICVVEERAIYGLPKVVHNVLVDYRNYKSPNTKYNLLHLTADEGTREGVSLKWASAYQNLQPNKDKLLIVLADGNPEHMYAGQSYTGSISASDTKAVAEQIEKKGTRIVAIALGEDCFPYLKQIYKNTILCDNLSKLPDQMIRVMKRYLFKD